MAGVEKKFKCQECGKAFKHKSRLERHSVVHSTEKKFKCTQCGKKFGYDTHLQRHIKIHIGEKTHKCEECGRCFMLKQTLKDHAVVHTGEKKFHCTICKERFTSNSSLVRHMKIHAGVKNFHCTKCDKSFIRKVTLTEHLLLHNSVKQFACEKCGKGFSQKASLWQHKRRRAPCNAARMPPPSKQRTSCPHCGKWFSLSSSLLRHLRNPHFPCSEEEKQRPTKVAAPSQPQNSSRKRFPCIRCGKKFSQMVNLWKHKTKRPRCIIRDRTQEGTSAKVVVASFKCVECQKTFLARSDLRRHSVVHTGEKKYVCVRCGMKFAHNAGLWKHKRRRVPCIKKENVQQKTVDPVMALKCVICGDEPGIKSNLVDQFKPQDMGFRYICLDCDVNLDATKDLGDYFRKCEFIFREY